MKRKTHSGPASLLASFALLLSLGTARATTDAFLQLGNLAGESVDAAHGKWIDIGSLQWNLTGSSSTNAARLSGLQLTKRVDAASPLLHLACASGKHFPKATLDLVRPGRLRVRYYRIILEDVVVTASQANQAAAANPVEALGLTFARMTWTYTEFDPDGRAARELTSYWDVLSGAGESSSKDAMRVSGAPSPTGGGVNLSFPSNSGVTYRILGSDDPIGPYTEVSRFTADATGATSATMPAAGSRQFFYVEEVP